MGASASKTAGAAARQYPKRPPPTSNPSPVAARNAPPAPPAVGPTVKPPPRASETRDAAINADASDPDLAARMRRIGPVQPNPTFSQTSAFNPASAVQAPNPRLSPAIRVLEARARVQGEADKESAQAGKQGRQFLDVFTIRQMLVLRDMHDMSDVDIEKRLGLKPGVVARLGPKGMLGLVTEVGRQTKGVDMV